MGWRKLVLFCACLLLLQFAMGSFANALPQEEGLWDHLKPRQGKGCFIPLCCCKPHSGWLCGFKPWCCC
ncbi:hypothetical protein MPTK1_4g14780 [Marchantia polymorpha subsp. ruderalis]|uniref:Uncharacterized protein n=2 Tax=Marchantia polymorpha TaxID=3197 RepID=A0AAF6B9Z1_MARPO|nr:hypothetical protein MARPO_0119s0004 [Marchantia polymorpha]BBN08825.1 hypothetical protein Mp_4g14780 [Marchantia polymorpha subsp. ruderalis]|eukprot:PTQ30794.1 hypothetical protein MARPO_0119s0004 [Marchantia polymorpha]